MTTDEKFESYVWLVLQKIKERSMYRIKGKPVEYWIQGDLLNDSPIPYLDEKAILEKIEEMGAVRILNPGGTGEYE